MRRLPPRTERDEIDLYIRTYYSLLRSTGDVWVRAFEEAHIGSESSLHTGAGEPRPDVAAFAYSAARLPECMPNVSRLVLGQSVEHFEAAALSVRGWERLDTRGRRRALRWDGAGTLAVFITSASDIDDLIPIVTCYQIEWNKMHELLADAGLAAPALPELAEALSLEPADVDRLVDALGAEWESVLPAIARGRCDFRVRLLYGSFAQYQRSAHRWWAEIEPHYLGASPGRRPVYFVSSNTHSLSNLVGGYARAHREEILEFAREQDPEELARPLEEALEAGDDATSSNILYYLLRSFLREGDGGMRVRVRDVQEFDREAGIRSIASPGRIDVSAQLFELSSLIPERLDPRARVAGVERLRESDAVIINIDYPLGLAAYHHFSRIAQGIGELRGVYVMGKAATLNARVGDVLIAKAVYDEHSQNSYLFRNCFSAADIQPYMQEGTVLDNQKAVTVRSAFLQNRDYMSIYYNRGYTILEMEAGPYLSSIYEVVSPKRHPDDEIVHMSTMVPFDVGFIHYASDTPYSRRQHLLSKSLSYFGVESSYGASIAILRRILESEVSRLARAG